MLITQYYNKDKNVLEATRERISFIFDNYPNIICSVSGGKDSTVLCHLVMTEAVKRNRKVGIFFLDEEVVYDSTIKQIEYLMGMYPENTIKLWYQIEFNLTHATSYTEPYLKVWEAGKSKIWMRPKKDFAIKFPPWDKQNEIITNKHIGLDFYNVISNIESTYKDTAIFVGLRATESMNRWRAVTKNPVKINDKHIYYATKKANNCINAYPLYDWNFSDVWKYIYDNKLKYSRIYDYMFKKGLGVQEVRVSSLIHEKSFKAIAELPEYEPKTYNKLAQRIEGIVFAQETAKSNKMFKVRKLPKNFKSWIQYRNFLLTTFQDVEKKNIFIKRFKNHLDNEFVARQQCRQLILNDYENNLPVINKEDPRIELINYYKQIL